MRTLRLYWWFFIGFILSISLIPCIVKAVDGDPVIEGQTADNVDALGIRDVTAIDDTTEATLESELDHDQVTGAGTVDTAEEVQDTAGAMVTGNTETRITVTYQDDDGTFDFVVDAETDPNALLTADIDNVKDTHLDWGTGAGQVSADDIPDGATNAIITLTQETNFGTAYTHSQVTTGNPHSLDYSDLGLSSNQVLDWTSDQGATNIHAGNYTDTNTTYTAGGTLLNLTGTTFSLLEGTLTNGKYCTYVTGTGLVCNSDGGSGYTNLTSFVDQTAWRLFYSDGSGDVKELSFGSDGEYLKSNGTTAALSWGTPSGAAHDAVTLSAVLGSNLLGLSTQELTLDTQTANYVFAGPTSGGAAAPAFRALGATDIPSLPYLGSSVSWGGDLSGTGASPAVIDDSHAHTATTVSGLTTATIGASTLVTAAEGIGSNNNDTTLPTSAAVKAYADSVGGGSMTYPGSGIALSTGSAWGDSITNNSSNWNTAYGWGNHASAGYLTAETDPLAVLKATFTADSQVLVGTGSGTYAAESGATLRTSLGLGIADTPQFSQLFVYSGTGSFGISSGANTGTYASKIINNLSTFDNSNGLLIAVSRNTSDTSILSVGFKNIGTAIYTPYLDILGNGEVYMQEVYSDTTTSNAKLLAIGDDGKLGIGANLSPVFGSVELSSSILKFTDDAVTATMSYNNDYSTVFLDKHFSLGTGELTAGSINRASGSLTLEIGGTAEQAITSTETTFGGNIVIPNSGYIGSTSDTDAIQIEEDGDVVMTQDLQVASLSSQGDITLNSDLADVTSTLTFGRTTGGNATISWDGSDISLNNNIIAGDRSASTSGQRIISGRYASGELAVFGASYSSGAPFLGYGVNPSTSAEHSFLSSSGINMYRGALIVDNALRYFAGGAQTVAIDSPVTVTEVFNVDNSGNLSTLRNLTINSDLADVTSTLTFGRTTGGSGAISYDGSYFYLSKLLSIDSQVGGHLIFTEPSYNSASIWTYHNHMGIGSLSNAAYRMTIDISTGQIGMGTTSFIGTEKLRVNGSTYLDDSVTMTQPDSSPMSIKISNSNGLIGYLWARRTSAVNTDAYIGFLDADEGWAYYHRTDVGHMWRVNDTNAMYLNASNQLGINTTSFIGSEKLRVNGSGYFDDNVSADSFTDRTPFYEGDAIAEIMKIKGKDGEIDHSTLPDFARVEKVKKDSKGKESIEEGRDLGAMISILTVAVQQLKTRNDILLQRIDELEKKLPEFKHADDYPINLDTNFYKEAVNQ